MPTQRDSKGHQASNSGTILVDVSLPAMGEDAQRFQQRAKECRRIAAEAKDEDWRESLLDLAADLESEAASIDGDVKNTARRPNYGKKGSGGTGG